MSFHDESVISIHIRDQATHRWQDGSQMSAHPWHVSSIVLKTMSLGIFIVKVRQTKQVSFVSGFLYIYCLLRVDTGKLVFLPLATFSRGQLKLFLVHQPSYYPIARGVYCPHFPNQNCHDQIRWSRVLSYTHP